MAALQSTTLSNAILLGGDTDADRVVCGYAESGQRIWENGRWHNATCLDEDRSSILACSMGSPSIAPPLSGQVIGSVGTSFVVAEWKDAGGPPGPPRFIAPLHVHQNDDEAWYVLEGTLRVRVGRHEVEARAGSAVFVPRGTPHTYWNPNPAPLRYLLVMTPKIYGLIQEIHAMKDRTPPALRAVFKKYDSDLLDL